MTTRNNSKVRREAKGPRFIQYFAPVLETLTALGGSARGSEVEEYVLNHYPHLVGPGQMEVLQSGETRFNRDVHWARFYLTKAGLLGSSKRGVWNLTDSGTAVRMTPTLALETFKRVQETFRAKSTDVIIVASEPDADENAMPEPELVEGHYREQLVAILRSISPAGFERLCQRLLRESGFSHVEVKGKSGDGGIDGEGVLAVNALVSFKVLFQCKRYVGSVSSQDVRNFRGSMEGRAEKGIILTTGTFTRDARQEATRDGARPIELVDGEKLIEMFEYLELGLNPVKTYEIDQSFFDAFR